VTTAAVVLAAGRGVRFNSALPKVLHEAAGRPLLGWVLRALPRLDRVIVVVAHEAQAVRAAAVQWGPDDLVVVEQIEQRGTGHAVRLAAGGLDGIDTVLVVPGDTPLLDESLLSELLDRHASSGAAATLLTATPADPSGYGRVRRDAAGNILGIVEHRDADAAELAIREVNTSVYAFQTELLRMALQRPTTDNEQGEEYLTDAVVALAGSGVGSLHAPAQAADGVNDRAQLATVAQLLRRRILQDLMVAGVTVIDPATTYVDADVSVAPDVVLLPGTLLQGSTRVASGAVIGPNSRLVDTVVERDAQIAYSVLLEASVGAGASVGPFAYLRPGARLGGGTKVGTFVEVKNSTVGDGSKVPHLSYIGDTTIGRGANIGAATVTVNYDGYDKHRTVIGDGARIGSATMLVAPVTVGDGAYTGAGSVVTSDVPPGALAVERAQQRIVEGYAERRRLRHET
jgi:bifunctional UDP-N-acetylglucosamine pyrophosphorylase/glucosamine-1-phosphate N-acetyltransferase